MATLLSFRPARWWPSVRVWVHHHRPLAWVDTGFDPWESWRPDPPVMDRLIR